MFTVVPRPQIIDHSRIPEEPVVDVFDNSRTNTVTKGWSEEPTRDDLTYKDLKKHRDELLEADLVSKKRLKELEREKSQLIKLYEPTYQENKALKSHITHGPDVAKIKQLQVEKKLLKEEVFRLSEDNRVLVEQMKDAMQKSNKVRDRIYDKAWRDALDRASKRKGKHKENTGTNKQDGDGKELVSETEPKAEDALDKRLLEMEKKLKSVQDNIKLLKQEKAKIFEFQKNNPERKPTIIQDAVEGKLENDIDKLKMNIEEVEKKQKVLKTDIAKAKNETEKPKAEETKVQQTTSQKIERKSVEIQTDDVWDLVKKRKFSHKSKLTQTRYDNHKSTQTEFPKREQATNTLARRLKYINDLHKAHATDTGNTSVNQIDQTCEISSDVSTVKIQSNLKQRPPISNATPGHVKRNRYAKPLVKGNLNDDGVSLNDSSVTIGESIKVHATDKLVTNQTKAPNQRGNVSEIHKDNKKGSHNGAVPKVSKQPLRNENTIEMALKPQVEKQSKEISEYEDKIMVETMKDTKLLAYRTQKAKHKVKTLTEFRNKIVDDMRLPRVPRTYVAAGPKGSKISLESLDALRLNQSDTVSHRNKPGPPIGRKLKVKASSTDGDFQRSSRRHEHVTETSVRPTLQEIKGKFDSFENIPSRLKSKVIEVENLNINHRDESEYDAILEELRDRYKRPLQTVTPKTNPPTPKVRRNIPQQPPKVHLKDDEILKDPITHIATVNDTFYGNIDDDMAFTPIKFMTNGRSVGMDSLKLFL